MNGAPKLAWTGRWLMFAILAACVAPSSQAQSTPHRFHGGKVEWARLKSDSPYWDRHAAYDGTALELIRSSTSLNIDPIWYSASPKKLEELCVYPFLYSDSIAFLSRDEIANLGEYLRRGGFLFIDACVNVSINPDPKVFLRSQMRVLSSLFPDLKVGRLKPEHEVFSIYFKMTEFPPQTRSPKNNNWAEGPTQPLHAVFAGDRMIGIISISGFQCGWAGYGGHENAVNCARMLANIYVYAMTR